MTLSLASIAPADCRPSWWLSTEARARHRAAQRAANAALAHLPRVEIACGDDEVPPTYAYSEAEIEASWGQFRTMAPSWRRDHMERGYWARIMAWKKFQRQD